MCWLESVHLLSMSTNWKSKLGGIMFFKNTRSLRTWLFSLAAVVGLSCFIAAHAGAAISWWSKARHVQESDLVGSNFLQATSASGGNGTLVFDVVVSLYNDPQGDDEYDPADVNNDDQEKYEKIIEYWADSVYEQSNGAHRLGTVRIFTNGTYANRADVVWNEREWPRADPAGFGENGKRILFGDIFPDGCGSGCDKNMLNDAEGAGYTLGHE